MLSFATDISLFLHAQDKFEAIAIKTASAYASRDAQESIQKIANGVYRAIAKVAAYQPDGQNPYRFCLTIKKMAEVLKKEPPKADIQLKLASAVVVDEALLSHLENLTDDNERLKTAEQIAYGREYISELLRGVL